MDFLHGTSSKMPGVGDVRMESRRAQVICSTPKRTTGIGRSRLSRTSRSLHFSGPRSPGISPVSSTASNARDEFSDIDDFEVASFQEYHQKPTRIQGNTSRKTSVCLVSKGDSGIEEIQALCKRNLLDWKKSPQYKSARPAYEPLVIVSDEEDNGIGQKKKRTDKKMPTKLFNANSRNSGGERRPKKIVVNASFDDYEDDREEESVEDSLQNMSINGEEDEESFYVVGEDSVEQAYASDESYESVRSHKAVKQRKPSFSSLTNAEDILNESFCSDDEDQVFSGSANFNCMDQRSRDARERQKLSYYGERHESLACKPSCPVSLYGSGDEVEDKFEDSADFDNEYVLKEPCGDTSGRLFSMQKDMSGVEEIQYRMNTSGPRNSLYKFHSEGVVQNSKRPSVKGKPGRRRTVSQSSQTDSEENRAKDSGKRPRKAPQKKSSLADDKEGNAKKRGRRSSVKAGEDVPKPSRKPGRKKKSESQKSSDNSSNDKTSEVDAPAVKKTKKSINKSAALPDTVSNKMPRGRKRKSDEDVPKPSRKPGRKKKLESQKSSDNSSNDKTSEVDAPTVKKTKKSINKSAALSDTVSNKPRGRKRKSYECDVDTEEKSTLCEDIAGKRRTLHNPNASQGLSLNDGESSSSKDDSQHSFPSSPRLVRKRSAESSSDYLRKKVLTMRFGKSISNRSLLENEGQLVTSTPVKPSTSKIALSSSANMPDTEIVLFGNAEKGESEPTVNEGLERINEETEEDTKKNSTVKTVEEVEGEEANEKQKNKDEAEKMSSYIKESPSEEKENSQPLGIKKPKSPNRTSVNFFVDKILSEWPVDEICATSNEKLKQALSKPSKVTALVNGKGREIEAFVESSQIKFHKHKTQNIQYGPAVENSTYGSGLVYFTPGSDKGVSVAKQCNFIYVVLGGLVSVKINNETERVCKPGDFIVIPKGNKYNITGKGDKVSALVYFKCQGTETI